MNRPRSARPASARQATNRTNGTASSFKFSQHMLADLSEEVDMQNQDKVEMKIEIAQLGKDKMMAEKETTQSKLRHEKLHKRTLEINKKIEKFETVKM
jgi:predicted  nucleic acid-binding Zn-ribbon protein